MSESVSSLSSFDTCSSFTTAYKSVASDWPSNSKQKSIRDAIIHLLLDDRLKKVRCSIEQLVTPLNSLGDADGRGDVMVLTVKMIRDAFKNSGGEFFERLCVLDIGEVEGTERGESIFFGRLNKVVSGSKKEGNQVKKTDFGVHDNDIDAAVTCKRIDIEPISNHPLDNWRSFRKDLSMPEEVLSNLKTSLREMKSAKDGRASRDRRGKREREKKAKAAGQKRGRSPSVATDTQQPRQKEAKQPQEMTQAAYYQSLVMPMSHVTDS